MDTFFAELGRTVLARWKRVNFSPEQFPFIAQTALEENPPAEQVDLSSLIRDFLLNDEQPYQSQSGFGQPELVLFDDPRFYIQALFWLEGTTDIHQHMFSGAFHVMTGSSIHALFEFDDASPVSAHLMTGRLRMQGIHLLETGSTQPITSGRGYIHSLFHLETPSITIVVRTHTDPGSAPQFTYLPPHLAVDPLLSDALTARRKQLLDVLEKTEDPGYAEVVADMVAVLDFERGFFVLQNGRGYLRSLGEWDAVWEVFRAKHGVLAEQAAPTLDEIAWRDSLVALRGAVTDVDHRFFLALLLNAPGRAELLQLVEQRFPGDPLETVLRWTEELADQSEDGTWILDAAFPLEIELVEEEPLEVFLWAIRYCVEGKDPAACTDAGFAAEDFQKIEQAMVNSSLRVLTISS